MRDSAHIDSLLFGFADNGNDSKEIQILVSHFFSFGIRVDKWSRQRTYECEVGKTFGAGMDIRTSGRNILVFRINQRGCCKDNH